MKRRSHYVPGKKICEKSKRCCFEWSHDDKKMCKEPPPASKPWDPNDPRLKEVDDRMEQMEAEEQKRLMEKGPIYCLPKP